MKQSTMEATPSVQSFAQVFETGNVEDSLAAIPVRRRSKLVVYGTALISAGIATLGFGELTSPANAASRSEAAAVGSLTAERTPGNNLTCEPIETKAELMKLANGGKDACGNVVAPIWRKLYGITPEVAKRMTLGVVHSTDDMISSGRNHGPNPAHDVKHVVKVGGEKVTIFTRPLSDWGKTSYKAWETTLEDGTEVAILEGCGNGEATRLRPPQETLPPVEKPTPPPVTPKPKPTPPVKVIPTPVAKPKVLVSAVADAYAYASASCPDGTKASAKGQGHGEASGKTKQEAMKRAYKVAQAAAKAMAKATVKCATPKKPTPKKPTPAPVAAGVNCVPGSLKIRAITGGVNAEIALDKPLPATVQFEEILLDAKGNVLADKLGAPDGVAQEILEGRTGRWIIRAVVNGIPQELCQTTFDVGASAPAPTPAPAPAPSTPTPTPTPTPTAPLPTPLTPKTPAIPAPGGGSESGKPGSPPVKP